MNNVRSVVAIETIVGNQKEVSYIKKAPLNGNSKRRLVKYSTKL